MSKKAAFVIAGIVTTIVMVLVVGLAGGAHWVNQPASAADIESPPATAAIAESASAADVAALQAQLNDYQAALQQANTELQAAYDEIAALQAQGGYSGERDDNERGSSYFNGFGGD